MLLMLAASAGAEEPQRATVWYRASEECPPGPDFLGKLPGGSARARLADAGDHIDFVVTLVAAQGETVGRLERQTQSGTVAIRELRDVSCARVADALALSLGLALEPAPAPAAAASPAEPTPAVSSPPAPTPVAPAPVSAVPAQAQVAPSVLEVRRASTHAAQRSSLGLEGGPLFGVAPSALARAAAFLDLNHLPGSASDLSVRFAVVGALGSPSTAVGSVRQWLVAGRGEICPWRWGGARAGLRPCAAFELGILGASDSRSSGQQASSIWAAPGLGLRGGVALLSKLTLELGADALVPLVRSEVDAGSDRLYRSDLLAFSGQLGISIGPF
ncbi:MAG TPA: hypothetical protein VNW92_17115 [Polyangiaceae bacterium]|nr:hypothetical protein [Polyangiaceae bacterium]